MTSQADFDRHKNNPYLASPKARWRAPWYDSFAKDGRIAWLVFDGPRLLAEVKNEAQADNVVSAIAEHREAKA